MSLTMKIVFDEYLEIILDYYDWTKIDMDYNHFNRLSDALFTLNAY